MNPMSPTPGFLTVIVDLPFLLGLPNDTYPIHDPIKEIALIQTIKREGSRAFFRNTPITGPTPFADLEMKAREFARLQQPYSYIITSQFPDGGQHATLNVHTGNSGGFAEAKPYTELHLTFLDNDLTKTLKNEGGIMDRAGPLLNAFLDKYRLVSQDYRASRVGDGKNFYLATVHTSTLQEDEREIPARELIQRLFRQPRTFHAEIGRGAVNILGVNSATGLLPNDLDPTLLPPLRRLLGTEYTLLLSYDLLLEAHRALQLTKDYKLAIVHAATAVEAHVLHLLYETLMLQGSTPSNALNILDNDPDYSGMKNRLQRLDRHTKDYANGKLPYTAFLGTTRRTDWDDRVNKPRNRAMHAGYSGFTWHDAKDSIVTATRTIIFLDNRIPALAHPIQLTPPTSLQPYASPILF